MAVSLCVVGSLGKHQTPSEEAHAAARPRGCARVPHDAHLYTLNEIGIVHQES